MENFDKRMALAVIEDALTNIATPHGRGVAAGLCGAFYLCGLFNTAEWKAILKRIPADSCKAGASETQGIKDSEPRERSRVLN